MYSYLQLQLFSYLLISALQNTNKCTRIYNYNCSRISLAYMSPLLLTAKRTVPEIRVSLGPVLKPKNPKNLELETFF